MEDVVVLEETFDKIDEGTVENPGQDWVRRLISVPKDGLPPDGAPPSPHGLKVWLALPVRMSGWVLPDWFTPLCSTFHVTMAKG